MRTLIFTLLFLTCTANVFASQNKKTLKLRLQSPSGNIDDATIYFDQGIVTSYDVHQDAEKVFTTVAGVPQLFSYTSDYVPCSINGGGTLSAASIVPLGYKVGYAGTYTLSAVLIDNFDPTSVIKLFDKRTGRTIDLRQNFCQVQMDTTDHPDGRFFLQVSAPVQFNSAPSNCQNTGGRISIIPDSTIVWPLCQLLDAQNNVLATDSNVHGQIDFTNLAAGDYHVNFTSDQYTATDNFHLDGDFVLAGIVPPSQTIYTNEEVIFIANVTNASEYTWTFGDGTFVDGVANPYQIFFEPGTYDVDLNCTNAAGCSATAHVSVVVEGQVINGIKEEEESKAVSVYAFGKTVAVDMNGANINNAELRVANLLGQPVYSSILNTQKSEVTLDNQANGYYIVSVKNGGKVNTKRVFLNK